MGWFLTKNIAHFLFLVAFSILESAANKKFE